MNKIMKLATELDQLFLDRENKLVESAVEVKKGKSANAKYQKTLKKRSDGLDGRESELDKAESEVDKKLKKFKKIIDVLALEREIDKKNKALTKREEKAVTSERVLKMKKDELETRELKLSREKESYKEKVKQEVLDNLASAV